MKTSRLRLALLLATLGAGLVPFSFADDSTPPPPPHRQGGPEGGPRQFNPERRLARLTEELKLTQAQQDALRPILIAQADAMKAANDPALSEDQRREKMRAVFQEYRTKINAVLTPEQQEQLAQMRRPRDHEGRGGKEGKDGNRPPPPPQEAGE